MKHLNKHNQSNEAGFTLVELAIVMIIIGLLIGGILKGQELIANAQIAATITQTRNYDSGIGQFRDSYAAFPGDMLAADAAARIPNCAAAACSGGGNGNGRWETALGAPAGEAVTAFDQMVNAGTIAGSAVLNTQEAPSDGFLSFGRHNGGVLVAVAGGGAASAGNYVFWSGNADGTPNNIVEPRQAARVDRKVDDGSANTGTVQAAGDCHVAGVYNEAAGTGVCSMGIGISN